MASKLRRNPSIHGIKIKDIEYLISQFADDMDLYLPFEKTVLNAVIDTFSEIETNTGLTISYDKTALYRIGSLANTDAKIITKKELCWTNQPVNTLGIDLYSSKKEMLVNLEKIILKVDTVSRLWYYRSLTLMGKILVVNTLIMSLFIYKLMVLPEIPSDIMKKIEKSIENFIWNGKKPKISLQILQEEKVNGGLGLTNITL